MILLVFFFKVFYQFKYDEFSIVLEQIFVWIFKKKECLS